MPKKMTWVDPLAGVRGHHLLTEECLQGVPRTGAESETVHIKLFSPYSGWTWYISELDPDTGHAYGIVRGHKLEYGYFNVFELAEIRFENFGNVPAVERDLQWKPSPIADVEEQLRNEIIL